MISTDALIDELQKIAAADPELQKFYEATEGRRQDSPGVTTGFGVGGFTGAALGGLAGGYYGGPGILGRLGGAGLGAIGFGGLGAVAGGGIGGMIDKARGVKGELYTPEERKRLAVQDMLEAYSREPDVGGYTPWDEPKGIDPEQMARHKRMVAHERKYVREHGRSPY